MSKVAQLAKRPLWSSSAAPRFGQYATETKTYHVPNSSVEIPVEAIVVPKNFYRNAEQKTTAQILQKFVIQSTSTKKKKYKRPLQFNMVNAGQTRPFSTQQSVWAQKPGQKPLPSIFNNPMTNRKPASKPQSLDKPSRGNKPPVSSFGFNALGGNGKTAPKTKKQPQGGNAKFGSRDRAPHTTAIPAKDERELISEFLKNHTPALTSYTTQAVLEIHTQLQENPTQDVIYVSEAGDIAGDTVNFFTLIKNPKLDLANKSLKLVKQNPAMVKTQSLPSYVTPKYKLDNMTKEEKAAMKAAYKAQRKQAKAEEKQKKKAVENNRNLLEIHSTWSINLRDLRQQKFRKLTETLKEGRPAVVSFASKNVRNAIETKRPVDPELLTAIDRERRQLLVDEVRVLAEECGASLNVSGSIDLLMTMKLKP